MHAFITNLPSLSALSINMKKHFLVREQRNKKHSGAKVKRDFEPRDFSKEVRLSKSKFTLSKGKSQKRGQFSAIADQRGRAL